jgi:hypothetical protein
MERELRAKFSPAVREMKVREIVDRLEVVQGAKPKDVLNTLKDAVGVALDREEALKFFTRAMERVGAMSFGPKTMREMESIRRTITELIDEKFSQ